jgi:hypothetical protein
MVPDCTSTMHAPKRSMTPSKRVTSGRLPHNSCIKSCGIPEADRAGRQAGMLATKHLSAASCGKHHSCVNISRHACCCSRQKARQLLPAAHQHGCIQQGAGRVSACEGAFDEGGAGLPPAPLVLIHPGARISKGGARGLKGVQAALAVCNARTRHLKNQACSLCKRKAAAPPVKPGGCSRASKSSVGCLSQPWPSHLPTT